MTSRLHVFVFIDSGHGILLDQFPEVWLLQDWFGTSVGGVNPVALKLPVIFQVKRPSWQGPIPVGLVSVWLSFQLGVAVSVQNCLLTQLAHMWVSSWLLLIDPCL